MQFNDLTPLPQTFPSLIKACDSFTLIIGGEARDEITQFCKICKGFCQILQLFSKKQKQNKTKESVTLKKFCKFLIYFLPSSNLMGELIIIRLFPLLELLSIINIQKNISSFLYFMSKNTFWRDFIFSLASCFLLAVFISVLYTLPNM